MVFDSKVPLYQKLLSMNPLDKDLEREKWSPDKYIKILEKALDSYERDHPHWQVEVLVSLLEGSLKSLRHYIDDANNSEITWSDPFVELHYPVEWNWESKRIGDTAFSGMVLGGISKQNTANNTLAVQTLTEIMVCRLNTLALGELTNGAWFEKENNYYLPVLPEEVHKALMAIKGKRKRRKVYEDIIRPFSIGAASIELDDVELSEGKRIPIRIAKQLENIGDLIDINGLSLRKEINGQKIEAFLVFQIHPLIADYDAKKAYHPIVAGIFIKPQIVENEIIEINPLEWPSEFREALWDGLAGEIERLKDRLIPRAERQTSEILSVNAKIEIPLASGNPEERNAFIQKIVKDLSETGAVREINFKHVRSDEGDDMSENVVVHSNAEDSQRTFADIVGQPFLRSRFRWPIAIMGVFIGGCYSVYAILPEDVKLNIFNYLYQISKLLFRAN